MAQQTINIGAAPDDATGDNLRTGGDKINDNFTELYGLLDASAEGERIRDIIGTALAGGSGIAVTVNDAGDTITIAVDTTAEAERVRDTIGSALVAGSGVTITVNDAGDTITIASTVTGGATAIDGLSDVDTSTSAPATGDLLRWDGTNWVPANRSFGLLYNKAGATAFGTDWLFKTKMLFACTLPANCSGSYAANDTNSTASKVFDLKKNGSSVATITFNGATITLATTGGAAQTFAAGDVVELYPPTTTDTTLAGVDVALLFKRS